MKCTSTGCPWINELGSLNDHLHTCGYVLVLCSKGCKQHIVRDKHLLHCAEECPLRRHMCKHCKAEGPYKEMIGGHLDKCPDLIVPCPNSGCEVSIKRKDMASHHLECPHETISCPYKDVGCTYTSPRHTMADHKATSCGNHLDLAIVQLKKQGEEIRNMHCTTLVIKVSQFSELKANNNVWYTPGFYTHTCGYKMCLRVDANGRGAGKGTHVSVYLCLMKGENDDALTWPIKYKCTFTLLNQLKDEGHDTGTISFTEDEAGVSRVLDGKKETRAHGYDQFIAHTELDLQEEEQCQYLKDDSLYFRVQVDLIPAVKPWLMQNLP